MAHDEAQPGDHVPGRPAGVPADWTEWCDDCGWIVPGEHRGDCWHGLVDRMNRAARTLEQMAGQAPDGSRLLAKAAGVRLACSYVFEVIRMTNVEEAIRMTPYSPTDLLHDPRVQAVLVESAGTINGVPCGESCDFGWPEGCAYHLPDDYDAWCKSCTIARRCDGCGWRLASDGRCHNAACPTASDGSSETP